MTAVDGVEDSFDRAIVVERRDRVFVAAIFNLNLNSWFPLVGFKTGGSRVGGPELCV